MGSSNKDSGRQPKCQFIRTSESTESAPAASTSSFSLSDLSLAVGSTDIATSIIVVNEDEKEDAQIGENEIEEREMDMSVNNPSHPYNFSLPRKIGQIAMCGLGTLSTQMCSSMLGPSISEFSKEYKVSKVVAIVPTGIFMHGMAFGPVAFGPLSELYGRKWVIWIPLCMSGTVTLLTFFVRNIAGIIVMRLVSGFLASSTIVCCSAVIKDLTSPEYRTFALSSYAFIVAFGPALGPFLGGKIISVASTYYIFIALGAFQILIAITASFLPETYFRIIQTNESNRLQRLEDKNHNDPELAENKRIIYNAPYALPILDQFLLPYKMLCTTVDILISIMACFSYGLMHMGVSILQDIVITQYNWSPESAANLSVCHLVGVVIGISIISIMAVCYNKKLKKRHTDPDWVWDPEFRLYAVPGGGFSMSLGYLLMYLGIEGGWGYLLAGQIVVGAGFFAIFQTVLNYSIDIHGEYAASAVASMTIFRSIAAGILPISAMAIVDKYGYKKFYVGLGSFGIIFALLCLFYPMVSRRARLRSKYTSKVPN